MAYNPGGSRSYGGGGYRGGGGGRSYGGGGGGGRGGHGHGGGGPRRGPMEMHQATCADCGKSCEVPFRPSGNKPVFCSNCFKSKDGGGGDFERRDSGGGGGRRSYGDRDYSDRPPMEMHQAICTDCGRDCEVPFKPTGDKPIFCDKCFGKNKEIKMGKPSGGNTGNSSDLSAKFDMLNIKLDRILKALDVVAAGKIMAQEKRPESKKEVKTFEAPKAPAKTQAAAPSPAKSVIKKVKSGKAKAKKSKM